MALLLLQLPPCLQPRLSLAPPNPAFPFSSSPSSAPQISKAGSRGGLLFDQRFSSIAAVIGSSTTEAEAAPAAEGSVETPAESRRRLIALNIPWACTAEDIRSLFERHGTVIDVELSMHNSSRNRGLAFITMASEEEALAALNNLDSYVCNTGQDLGGRVIKVEFSRSLKKNPSPASAVPVEKYNVFVGNLTWRVRSRDLREVFIDNENVLSVEVIFQTNPRRSAGYGFLSFSSKEAAESAIATFNGKRLMGRPIRLVMKDNQTYDVEGKSDAGEKFAESSSVVNAGEDLSEEAVEI